MSQGGYQDGQGKVQALSVPASRHVRVILTVQPSSVELKRGTANRRNRLRSRKEGRKEGRKRGREREVPCVLSDTSAIENQPGINH